MNEFVKWFKKQHIGIKFLVLICFPYMMLMTLPLLRNGIDFEIFLSLEFWIIIGIAIVIQIIILIVIYLVPPDQWEYIREYFLFLGSYLLFILACVCGAIIGWAIGSCLKGC